MGTARAIGIDLGTSYSLAATIEDGRPKIIPNREGQRLTPSVVAFTREGGPLVGQAAKRQAAANPDSTVFSIKRFMGSNFKVKAGTKEYSPQEVSALILRKVKADAEDYLGERIDRAVITVPAYFNDRQRQATKEAGLLAGLDVMRIINEPTAAALAYGLDREDVHTILVWDLGGGTFDVSILELGEGIFEVRAVSGDSWLGGDDFDARVAAHLEEEYKRAHGKDFPTDGGAKQRLREAAEKAKILLSWAPSAPVRVPFIEADGRGSRHLEAELTRDGFEALTADLLQRMAGPTTQALKDAGMAPAHIDRVILAGGATRMSCVRRLARELLAKEPYRYLNPDEVVALGAAIQAGMLLGLVRKAILLDVLPLSLGVETRGGLMARLIPRNTPLPAAGARIFTTAADFQTSMDIHVLQGERELAVDNISLGQFRLHGIPPAARGSAKVEVALNADVDGVIQVSAKELSTESAVETRMVSCKSLDRHEIVGLTREAQGSAEQDRELRERVQAAIEADNLIAAAEQALEGLSSPETEGQVRQIVTAIWQVKAALASGVSRETRRRSAELRRLLQAASEDRSTLVGQLANGGQ
ncbi:MAG: molecular chaperone DnaK [Chloroflexi bacterium]|nr:molecular chaperone DnaK [Chloroflexota bacterium]